ncbi:hypothetical protein CEW81_03515 [Kluyvera genomosp. 3]|uniref:HNH nuclease domain-containing protein n=1 Tax=Kluyvera genomosp. 3 TaxID=2774055 RepID=A0A248KGJ4_9ENTR|nr:hypothetical protein CEW81_03515 [Kluyvera genomosp. 3]
MGTRNHPAEKANPQYANADTRTGRGTPPAGQPFESPAPSCCSRGQGRFRLQVLANYHGACCITGLVDGVEAAHIVPHRETANQHPNNGLPLIKALHAAFDSGFFSINPAALRVVVREDARGWLNIDGKQIDDGGIWQIDRIALAKHYEAFMKAQSQSGIGNSQSNN